MNKDYFFVPYDAILPNSWQKIYRNPSQGDDVPSDANTVIPSVRTLFLFAKKFVSKVQTFFHNGTTEDSLILSLGKYIYMAFPLMDAFFSSSGLLSRLGYNNNHSSTFTIDSSFFPTWDRCAEVLYPLLFPDGVVMPFTFSNGGVGYKFTIGNASNFIVNETYPNVMSISGRDALSFMRYFPDYIMSNETDFLAFLKGVRAKHPDALAFDTADFLAQSVLEPKNLVFNRDEKEVQNY